MCIKYKEACLRRCEQISGVLFPCGRRELVFVFSQDKKKAIGDKSDHIQVFGRFHNADSSNMFHVNVSREMMVCQ